MIPESHSLKNRDAMRLKVRPAELKSVLSHDNAGMRYLA